MNEDLERLYTAMDDDDAWAEIPALLARLCGGRSCTLTRIGKDGAPLYTDMSYFPREAILRYYSSDRDWIAEDAWARVASVAGLNQAMFCDDLLPPEKFRETAMWNEFFRPLGDDTARCAGIVSTSARDTVILGIHRAARDHAFTRENADRVATMLVHLRRVFRGRDALEHARSEGRVLADMLELTGQAMMLVDRGLRVRRMTRAAKAIVDRRDGIRHVAGRLALDDARAHQHLQAAVNGVVSRVAGAPGAFLCPRPSALPFYRLAVLPAGGHARDLALVILDDPSASRDGGQIGRFAQAYGLTPAEIALVKGLAEGLTLEEIAAARDVTKGTTRDQLKTLLQKVNVRRQIDLMKLILRMP